MIYQMIKFFKRIGYFIPRWSQDLYFDLEIQKNTGYLYLTFLTKEVNFLTFSLIVTEKKLTDSRKREKLLADNSKSHPPNETL